MEVRCRHFNGYKPCGLSQRCDANCAKRDILKSSVLIVHLGAMGAVVRSTALLEPIQRKYAGAQITWVTDAPCDRLLAGHPRIDKVVRADATDLLSIAGREFDVALVIDKSDKASGVLSTVRAKQVFGFVTDSRFGKIGPATLAAVELWELGLDDELKFFVNQKTENQLIAEALELGPYERDEYDLPLSISEKALSHERMEAWRRNPAQPIIGFNTGCGPLMPAKKWTVEFHRQVIEKLLSLGFENLVLLGGPEDEERNRQIAVGLPVQCSPCTQGLRDGVASIAACDVVLTGDSFGMHVAIALKKFVVAWFGPSCAHEIDLFDRGVKLHAQVGCSPCWKRSCQTEVMCYDRVSMSEIQEAVQRGANWWHRPVAAEVIDSRTGRAILAPPTSAERFSGTLAANATVGFGAGNLARSEVDPV